MLGRPLPGREFDVIIDCQTRLRTTFVLRRIRHRSFVSAAAGYRLCSPRPEHRDRPRAVLHHFIRLAEIASGQTLQPDFEVRLPELYREAAARALPAGRRYVGLAPGAGDRRKAWPLESFLEVASRQAAAGRIPVFLLGPDEASWRETIAARIPGALFPVGDCDSAEARGSPLLTIALAERLTAAVSNECGTGHMLGTGRCPLVTLFGPTSPEKFPVLGSARWTPLVAASYGQDLADIPVDVVCAALDQTAAWAEARGR